MIVLTQAREARGFSKRQLEKACNVCASDLTKAETRGLRLYPVQLERIAHALGWEGDPMELLNEVSNNELPTR